MKYYPLLLAILMGGVGFLIGFRCRSTPSVPVATTQDSVAAQPESQVQSEFRLRVRSCLDVRQGRTQHGALILGEMQAGRLSAEEWEDGLLALGVLRYNAAIGYIVEHITHRRVDRVGDNLFVNELQGDIYQYPAIKVLQSFGHLAAEPLLRNYIPEYSRRPPGPFLPSRDRLLQYPFTIPILRLRLPLRVTLPSLPGIRLSLIEQTLCHPAVGYAAIHWLQWRLEYLSMVDPRGREAEVCADLLSMLLRAQERDWK